MIRSLYSIERSVERNDKEKSQELTDALKSANCMYFASMNQKIMEEVYNTMLSASGKQGLTLFFAIKDSLYGLSLI